jgi:hypothetical protein
LATSISDVHPSDPSAGCDDTRKQSKTGQQGHTVCLQSQGGADFGWLLSALNQRHLLCDPTEYQAGRQPPIPAPTTTTWSTALT